MAPLQTAGLTAQTQAACFGMDIRSLVEDAFTNPEAADRWLNGPLSMLDGRSPLEIARSEKLNRVTVEILAENLRMLEVCRGLGFRLEYVQDGVVHGVLDLTQ